MQTPTIDSGSVKVMRSYDYCHFEVTLSTSGPASIEFIDELRKQAARLADKAVEQYKVAKDAMSVYGAMSERWRLQRAMGIAECDRTPQDKAIIKFHGDKEYASRFGYDYQDDWANPVDWDDEI